MSPSLYPLSSHLLASLGQTSGWGWRGFGTPGYSRRKGLSWREEKIFKKNVKNLKPDHHCKVATWHKTSFTVTRLCPSILPYLLLINSSLSLYLPVWSSIFWSVTNFFFPFPIYKNPITMVYMLLQISHPPPGSGNTSWAVPHLPLLLVLIPGLGRSITDFSFWIGLKFMLDVPEGVSRFVEF